MKLDSHKLILNLSKGIIEIHRVYQGGASVLYTHIVLKEDGVKLTNNEIHAAIGAAILLDQDFKVAF